MESSVSIQPPETECLDVRKVERKNINAKSKAHNSMRSRRLKRQPRITYLDDDIDNDVILRMVLPGYNWFEDQVKNNMYTTQGKKKIFSKRFSVNQKLKTSDQLKKTTEILVNNNNNNTEVIMKHKLSLTKRVINSTLMLLPNNSLPLKKRKIKEDVEENEIEVVEKIEDQLKLPIQETKKVCSPPIQKVIPISVVEDVSSEIIVPQIKRHSAFRNEHIQMNPSFIQSHPNVHNKQLDPIIQYNSIMKKKAPFPISDMSHKYPSPYQQMHSNFCYQCNMYRKQASELNKLQNTDCSKLGLQSNSQQSYWPSNSCQTYSYYDPLAIPVNDQTYSRIQKKSEIFDNYKNYATPEKYGWTEAMPLNYCNINTSTYCPNNYWNKETIPSYNHVIKIPSEEYIRSKSIDSLNTVLKPKTLLKGFHPLG